MYFKCKYLPHERDEQSSMGHVSPLHRTKLHLHWIAIELVPIARLLACNASAPHPNRCPNSLIIK